MSGKTTRLDTRDAEEKAAKARRFVVAERKLQEKIAGEKVTGSLVADRQPGRTPGVGYAAHRTVSAAEVGRPLLSRPEEGS